MLNVYELKKRKRKDIAIIFAFITYASKNKKKNLYVFILIELFLKTVPQLIIQIIKNNFNRIELLD